MAARYAVATAEFGDVIKAYPDDKLSGNSFFYLGEIDYRAARYAAAVRDYDKVLEQFPDSNKIPAAHLHKGQALIEMKQTEAGIREFRTLIQRFPAAPESTQARSKLNAMGVPIRAASDLYPSLLPFPLRGTRPMTLPEIVKADQDALAAETRAAQCPPFVAVNELEIVRTMPSAFRAAHPVTITPLEPSSTRSYVVDCPSLHSKVLWVTTANNQYREDYLAFINRTHSLTLTAIPKSYDVDHLYNRTRAQSYAMKFIRTALVGYTPNRSHGAGYEKDITTNEALRFRKDRKLMDEITCMKFFGFLSPLRSDPRDAEVDAYATFAASHLGLSFKEVKDNVLLLRGKASNPWAKR